MIAKKCENPNQELIDEILICMKNGTHNGWLKDECWNDIIWLYRTVHNVNRYEVQKEIGKGVLSGVGWRLYIWIADDLETIIPKTTKIIR